ncbi:MAG: hypothetical protein ABI925_08595 [Verrucomicrobiota bacterium]
MKTLTVFAIALAGLVVWQYMKVADLSIEVALLRAQLKSRPTPAPPPKPVPTPAKLVEHVVCPLCHGLQVLLYDGGRKKDNCPLCVLGSVPVGYRDVPVNPNVTLCPNCRGMGKIVVNLTTHPPRTENCVLCAGTGVVPRVSR